MMKFFLILRQLPREQRKNKFKYHFLPLYRTNSQFFSPDGEDNASACCRSCCSPSTPGGTPFPRRRRRRPAAPSAATTPTRWVPRCARTTTPWTSWTWWSSWSPPSTPKRTRSCRCATSAGQKKGFWKWKDERDGGASTFDMIF